MVAEGGNTIDGLNNIAGKVAEKVMESAKLNTSGPPEGPTAEQLRGWLEGLNDEDLGRYKM